MELEACRQEIDRIDHSLAQLLEQRMHVVAEVAAYKEAHQMPVYDHRRELLVMDKVAALIEDAEVVPYIQQIYRHIMDESKAYERARIKR